MAKHALCIGINDYPGAGSNLAGCVNDAKDWAAALGNRGFSVTTLLNKKAGGAAMRSAIRAIVTNAASGDVVVVSWL